MKDQHKMIKGYRDLSQEEIDLINEIKVKAEEMRQLYGKVYDFVDAQAKSWDPEIDGRHLVAEPFQWLYIAKTDLQTGVMALTRAVAQPTASW